MKRLPLATGRIESTQTINQSVRENEHTAFASEQLRLNLGAYSLRMAETISELKAELIFQEKRMSKIQQHPELGSSVVDCANKIAALREKIKKLENKK